MNKLSGLAAATLSAALLSGCATPDDGAYAAAYVRQFNATNVFLTRAVVRPDGLKINAREFGVANEDNGPTIILMHGFPDSQHLYDAVVPLLAKSRHVITFDFVGWGDSDKPVNHLYDVASVRQDLEAVVASFDPKSVVLVVHDLSGQPGIDWALDKEPRVSALVLLNTYYSPHARAQKAPEAIARFSTPGLLRDLSVWGANRSDAQWESGVAEQNAKFFGNPAARATYSRVFAHQALGIRPAFFGENAVLREEVAKRAAAEPRLKSFGRPVEIVFGAEDQYLDPGVAQEFHQLFPRSGVHLISHAAHYVQLDAPDAVATQILGADTTNEARERAAP